MAIAERYLLDVLDRHVNALCREAAREEPFDEGALDAGAKHARFHSAVARDEIALFIEAEALECWAASLRPKQWRIFLWHERDGRTAEDIARELGCSARSVERVCLAMREAVDRHVDPCLVPRASAG